MKRLLIIPMFLISLFCSAATYYIDPSGSDSNNGSSSSPWRTLTYACSKVTTAGDIIHVNSGSYAETTQSKLAAGVSIEGSGVTSIIKSQVGGSSPTILLSSGSEGTNGNQHISYIKMDGSSLTGYGAIKIDRRKNVEIHHCTFVDFNYYGVWFDGSGNSGQPSTYPTGNKFYDNIVTNCSLYAPANDPGGEGWGLIKIEGQQDMLVYNNTLDQTSRSAGNNGYLIKAIGGRNKGIKIYNNTMTKNPCNSNTWDFAIEFWNTLGGIEIYDNVITASIDFSGAYGQQKGDYDYSVWIHDNTIGPASMLSTYALTKAIYLEQSTWDAIVERNYIRNVGIGIYFPLYKDDVYSYNTVNNINIRSNIFENIGVASGSSKGWGIYFNVQSGYANISNNFNVNNNVFIGHTGSITPGASIYMPSLGGTTTNVNIKNNIVENFTSEPVYIVTNSGLSIENNIFFNNGNSNVPKYTGSGTIQNNLTTNPLFISSSDHHLQASSPAIGKGLPITGITSDYDGTALKNPPSIGAFESSSAGSPVSPVLPVYQNSAVENAAPNLLSMTYSLTLANIAPLASSFSVKVNTVVRNVNAVTVSGTKVLLTLTSPVISGDVVTVAYTKPATSPLQIASGGQASSINAQSVTNKTISIVKDVTPVTISMTITPNHVHNIISLLFGYSSSFSVLNPALSPQIIRIFDKYGKLLREQVVVTGVSKVVIPINFRRGIYTVLMLSGGIQMSSQKIIVY